MHIAFVDANAGGLQVISAAKAAGHRVTFLEPPRPGYPRNAHTLAVVGSADRVIAGVATTDPDEVTDTLAKVHAEEPLDAACSPWEYAVEAVAVACRRLGLRGTTPAGVLTARRKDRARAALDRAGVASARFAYAADERAAIEAAQRIGYPVVVKPPSGAGSRLAAVARDAAAVAGACRAMLASAGDLPPLWQEQYRRGFLIEERLAGPMVSVEIGRRGGEFFPFAVAGRLRWAGHEVVELGGFIPADVSAGQAAACIGYAERVCLAIGLDVGVFHLEMIITDRGPVLVEANPRVMGAALPVIYQHATGHDIYAALVQLLAGGPVDVPPVPDGCTGGHKVLPARDGMIPADTSLGWLGSQPGVLDVAGFADFHTGPGARVHADQLIARFLLRAPDHRAFRESTAGILARLEHDLGLPLMTRPLD
jgi:ATP-grasp N-terminal domain/ATP-grasp domain